ncbi:GNAT family N-acetyltransferase [Desulfosporosinus sp. PR]|uniref:GNAT family N-acetyltransferase n=1 Tax=Candidatus Desulfosporosinus nitrosoreducens TaxID=3401928 RepID=UPI0027E9F4B1|nr:GNAT family N-acetyltransferase [Desulfosporosinus sp. PR]MDQ7094794.1 GNAT family N-acetyltransferase [Desulfosporosinus sp. PR]
MRNYFLRTTRLGFSVWSQGDLSQAKELWGNPEVTKFIVATGTMSDEQVHQRLIKEINTYETANMQYWPVYLLETDENIGCCGLRPYDYENKILEMGIHLKENYWGKGFAQEACFAVIEYAFNRLGVSALFAGHNPKNIASAQLLKKLGFKYKNDEYYPPTGLYHPSYLMAKQDYEARRKEQ